MSSRLSRAEQQTERNRAALLASARRVFLEQERGYHGASVDQIATRLAFPRRGVLAVRRQGGPVPALLEARIAERAAWNARTVEGLAGDAGLSRLLAHAASVDRAEPEWGLLVIEFRVQIRARPAGGAAGDDQAADDGKLRRLAHRPPRDAGPAEQHLAACADEPGLLDGQYVCLALVAGSGVRGVFVQTAEEYTEFAASVLRPAMAQVFAACCRPAACRSLSSRPPRRSIPVASPPRSPAVTRCG